MAINPSVVPALGHPSWNPWHIVPDHRTAAMRDADDELDRSMPDEADPLEVMRQTLVMLADELREARREAGEGTSRCALCGHDQRSSLRVVK